VTSTLSDVENALELLRAGFPGRNPTIDGDTAAVWHFTIGRFTPPVLVAAATSWPQRHDEFPSLNQFLGECQGTARSMARSEEERGDRGSKVCPDCKGTGWVEVDSAGQGSFQPCQRCAPGPFAKWAGGHFAREHTCETCRGR